MLRDMLRDIGGISVLAFVVIYFWFKYDNPDLRNWTREKTVWTSSSGSQVALYARDMAHGKDDEAIVCEQHGHRNVIARLDVDRGFALFSGNELEVFRVRERDDIIDLSRRCP